MILFKAQNEFDAQFQDQIIIESYPVSEMNNNIFINLEHIYKSKEGIIRTGRHSIEIFDEFVDDIDIDFIDKEYIIVDPAWDDCPENFDLYDIKTWPEGMVYPEIPKIIKPDYIEKSKYFSRLYNIIIACTSEDEIKGSIFQFIAIEEPQFLERIVGAANIAKWDAVQIDMDAIDKDIDTLKAHKIQILESQVSNRILQKHGLIKQLNYMSDSFYAVKTLSGNLNMSEAEIISKISSLIGKSNNISDLKTIRASDLDYSEFLAKLSKADQEQAETVLMSLVNIADSVLNHRMISAMRIWYRQKSSEILGAQSTGDVVKIMNNTKVPLI